MMTIRRCLVGSFFMLACILLSAPAVSAANRTLLFSDSPEMVTQTGVLYRDEVNGAARVFFHHVNDSQRVRYLSVQVTNPGATDVTLWQERTGLGVSADYLAAGKQAQATYWPEDVAATTLAPGEKKWLYKPLPLQPGQLATGMADWLTDGPVVVSVAMTDDRHGDRRRLSDLATTDLPLRGTYAAAELVVLPELNDAGRPESLLLADGKQDKFIDGWDALAARAAADLGNYGVVYRVWLPPAAEPYTVSLNPRGGVFAGVVAAKRGGVKTTYPVPAGRVFFGEGTVHDVAPLLTMPAGQSGWLYFSPPGASNLPVVIRFGKG